MPNSVGRPRDEGVDDAILDATAAILRERGYIGLKMDAVAAAAGVSKHSLYLRYRSPAELTVALLKKFTRLTAPIPDTGSLETDLKILLTGIRTLFLETPFGVVIPALVAASPSSPDLVAYARSYLRERRKEMAPIVERAVARGELPHGTDATVFLDLDIASLYYRFIISGGAIDDAAIDTIIRTMVHGR